MPTRPLLVTSDPLLLDDLLRVAALAGVEVDVCATPVAAGARWSAAPLVVLGPDAAQERPAPRRPGVVLVGNDLDDGGVWDRAVAAGAEHVVVLPDAGPWLADLLRDAAGVLAPGVVVGVVGGRGGAGATCLAVAVALAGRRRGLRVLLVDGDPLGGGIDLALCAEQLPGPRWPELLASAPLGQLGGAARLRELPQLGDLLVLAWDRGEGLAPPVSAAAMAAVLEDAVLVADLVVVDLPRAAADEVGAAALSRCATLLLVVPAQTRGAAAAAQLAPALTAACRDVRLVVREQAPGRRDATLLGARLRLPVAAVLRPEPDLDGDLERGRAPGSRARGPLARTANVLLDQLELPSLRRRAA